ncbi:MAG: VOC family protein [Beijerinckiaceae bacterium]|jgi:PhnB protein|nr:VOC family protein [Beijerinckiaceae bacterium]MDO9442142.1 VOC family protein [Beijerinckiaceae bacterium]
MTDQTGYKPPGHSDVSIYMMASDAQAVIDFASHVLGAREIMRLARDDGSIMHAEIKIGDSVVMISQGMPEYPAFPVWLHVYVPDVDAAYASALAYGATSVQAPERKGDPDKRGGVKDAAGNTWWISTHGA